MQVKCTSCGASQNISQAQNCDFCGNVIELESATNNYKTALSGESGNLMAMAETAIEATNWEEALQYFNRVLEKDITNSDAWLGKGIAIVYTSKIGDIKINEAIAYWKNALKHSTNQEAMGKRVAKEINEVVNKFYPSLENHFIQFKDLDNSYQELVSKFVILERAQNYATQLDSSNIKYFETGYYLCKRVIEMPKLYAIGDMRSAMSDAVIAGLQQNKYKGKDASEKYKKGNERKVEIEKATKVIHILEVNYIENIKTINPSHKIVLDYEQLMANNEAKEVVWEKRKSLNKKYGPKFAIAGFVLFVVFLIATNFLENYKENRGSLIFWGIFWSILGPWIIAEWLVKIKILK